MWDPQRPATTGIRKDPEATGWKKAGLSAWHYKPFLVASRKSMLDRF